MPHLITRRQSIVAAAGLAATLGNRTTLLAADEQPIGLGFSLYGMKALPLTTAIKNCREIGYDCVELPLMPGWAADPEKLQESVQRLVEALPDATLAEYSSEWN